MIKILISLILIIIISIIIYNILILTKEEFKIDEIDVNLYLPYVSATTTDINNYKLKKLKENNVNLRKSGFIIEKKSR